ncbi:hypothetical protein G3I34_04255 [Streptomyces sp. SID8014]|uniref:hypothetical protein n=1 Tax=Streptomyces sp. SID8014 TaxID=2706097 RepID=UPI0013BBB612|nr:hypothetical protein [Streptomyces sp. SID8014]NEC11530.1 hypothetical protein [Streptomyces sp. SID8014]
MEQRIFVELNAEWALVCAEPSTARKVSGWLTDAGVFSPDEAPGHLDDLLTELERRDRSKGIEHSDRWLAALIRLAAGTGPEAQLAARVVMQAMLPGAVRLTQRLMRPERDFDEVGQVVIACLYQVVRTYPASRKRRFAANLMLETLHWASRGLQADAEPAGVTWAPELTALPGDQDVPEEAHRQVLAAQAHDVLSEHPGPVSGARAELLDLLLGGVTAGLVDIERARVIASEVREGAQAAAEQAGVSAVAWRKRRSRTVRQLRTIAAGLAQAA